MIRVGIADFKGAASLRQKYGDWLDGIQQSDTLLVAHRKGLEIAWMAARPMMWMHSLRVNPELERRIQARGTEALFQYALGWGPAAPRLICGGLFQTSTANARMETIANSLGGVEEEDSRIWRLDL